MFKKNEIKSAKRTPLLQTYEPPLPEILDPPWNNKQPKSVYGISRTGVYESFKLASKTALQLFEVGASIQ